MAQLKKLPVQSLAPWWLAGTLTVALATSGGLLFKVNAVAAAALFVLAVVGAVSAGMLNAGLLASGLSFFCLNYFFTPPLRTFGVEKTEDLVALFVFLVVSVVVSSLFSSIASERRRAERREHEATAARLDSEASNLRAAVFSAVTHDLKTPITSIRASVDLLKDPASGLDSGATTELLEGISTSTDRLNRLVGNVLDLARLSAGAMEPRLESADVRELVGVVLGRMAPAMNGHKVEVRAVGYLPEVNVDVMQFEHIVSNILDNALRFSPPSSSVQVVMDVVSDAVRIKVSDRGPGIPVSERTKVMEPFYRLERDRNMNGSGLGLAIASAMLKAHGGTLTVDETPGGGAAITALLPVKPKQ